MSLLLLSTADTDLLAARAVSEPALPLRLGNPVRLEAVDLDGVRVVVVRLLGGRRAWDGLDALLADAAARRVPVVAVGGEGVDAELTALSTVPAGVVADAAAYLREGGSANLRELVAFLSDTVLLTGHGFAPPQPLPLHGVRGSRAVDPGRPTVGVVYYRAHELSGNTAFVDVLCDAVEAAGANALPVYAASLRPGADGDLPVVDELLAGRVDALVVTVLASGGSNANDAEGWDATALTRLDVPVLQGLCVTSSRAEWAASDAGLAPIDAAMQVAIPEFDGRLIGAPFSFKETTADGLHVYVADAERAKRVAGTAVAHARLRHLPNAEKKLALVLSSYPTKHSRVGNAVGLDTPASAVRLLRALRDAGYDCGSFPEDGDELVHTLIAAGGHDVEWLTEDQLRAAVARVPLAEYQRW
ncbi:MAG TPA: cobaltochelatase subunit CobN, partial [Mycobacteriales bacterium]|nr:cobaltochelatase subunit CobN [Mycobacteriales bacterium]